MKGYGSENGRRAWLVLLVLGIAVAVGCGDDDDDSQGNESSAGSGGSGNGGSSADGDVPTEGDASADGEPAAVDIRPVVFVHGGSGSAAQFESQAQRFMSNGYPLNYLAAYEHPTGFGAPDPSEQIDPLDEIIDAVLADTGADQVELMGHSRGGGVCFHYLESSAERAAKIAHYVAIDSGSGLERTRGMDRTPGNVEMLALWGEGDPAREVVGATNVRIPTQAHVETATAAASFVEMYEFFNGEQPETDQIVEATGDTVEIAGRVNYYPSNEGGDGTLRIFEVDPDTGYRISEEPVGEWITDGGEWGPQTIDKGATYEFAMEATSGERHSIYREPFFADNYFVRLITVPPGSEVESLLPRTADHTVIVIMRDKEIWGDRGDDNDILTVDGTNVATEGAAAASNRTIVLFAMDWGPGVHPDLDTSTWDFTGFEIGESNLEEPISLFQIMGFISAVDLYIPAASPPDRSIEVKLTPRGGNGAEQVIHIPNWASDEAITSAVFRDFVR